MFKDILIKSLDGGLFTTNEESKIPENYCPDMLNVDFESGGSIRNRQGSVNFGTIVNSLSGVRSLHNFKRQDGIEIPLRTWSTDVEYYNRQTSAWSRLSTGYTSDKVFDFTDYVDYTYFCNGVDALFRWNGRYGTVTDAHAASATALEVTNLDSLWLSAGEAIVGTQPIYYGSKTSGTLQSVTGLSAIITAGTEISQSPLSARGWGANVSSTPRGNILITNGDRVYLAGCSAEGQRMYYSKIGDPTDWTYSSTHVDNEGGYVTLGDGGAYITGLVNRGFSRVAATKKDAIKSFEFVQVDATHLDWPKVGDIAQSRNCGALTNKSLVGVEGDSWYVSPNGGVRSIADVANVGLTIDDRSVLIRPTMEDLSFVSASGIYYGKKYYIACKTTDSSKNNVVLVNDLLANERKGSWTRYNGWFVNDWVDFDGGLYYADAYSKGTYKVNLNYDDNSSAYICYYKTPLLNHGIPHEQKRLRYIYLEGYMTENAKLSCTVYYDALSSNSKQIVIYGDGAYVDPSTTLTFEDIVYGDSCFAGDPSGADFLLKKFRVKLSYSLQNLFNYQLEIKSNGAGMGWRIDQIAPYVEREAQTIFPVSNIVGY